MSSPQVDWGNQVDWNPPGPTDPPDFINHQKVAQSLIYSRMFNQSPGDAYTHHDVLKNRLDEMGVKSGPSIGEDIKVGAENSIFGLAYRMKMPETLQNPDMLDHFVSGLSTMVADLPFYLAGGVFGGAAGSEVPVVGNLAGAAIGSFAVPSAIRKGLTEMISKGEIKSFGDLMDRIGNTALAGVEGGVVGAATYGAGKIALPFTAAAPPLVGVAMKHLQQVAAMTLLPDLFEGRIPTAQEFAVNAALFAAMHYTAKSFGLADIAAQKVHTKMLDAYAEQGLHPADLTAEALTRSQGEESDPVDRLNEMAREARAVNPPEEEAQAKQPQDEEGQQQSAVTEPPPASLTPAIKEGDTVTAGAEGEAHDDVVGRTEGAAKGEEAGTVERGFVDRKGNFLTREEAKSWLRQNEPDVYKYWEQLTGDPNAELHTSDYNEARSMATGIKNAAVDAQREQAGLPPIEGPMRSMDPNNWEVAKEDVDSGRINALKIAQSINANPRGLSPEETNALNYYRAKLSVEHKTVMDSIDKARSEGNPQAEARGKQNLRDVEERINTVDEATKKAGTEWGLTGLMRQRMVAQDYSLDRLIQRLRVASPNGQVSDAGRNRMEHLSDQLDAANKKLEEYQTRQSEREAQRAVEKIKAETAKTQRKGERAQIRADLKVEFGNLTKEFDKLITGRVSSNPFFDPEVLGVLGKMAKNRIESGLTRIEDIVDDIHGALTNLGHDVAKRDLRDAITGYGKTSEMSKEGVAVALREAKAQGRLISALEDAEAKKLPLRSGLQREKASDRVRELQQQVKSAMREAGIDVRKSQTPERQWASALESVKTRLRNQIVDLNRQLQTGERPAPREGVALDDEAKALREQRNQLKEALGQTAGKREMTSEQRIKAAMGSIQRSIEETERRIKENDLTPSQRRVGRPEPREVGELRNRLDSLRETYREMKEAAEPKKTPEQAALDRFKKYTQKRIDDMQRRLSTGDFTKEPQQRTILDPEANALKAKAQQLRDQMNQEIRKQEYANRTPVEKALHVFSKWRRWVLLTNPHTFGKLAMAANYRMGATPVEEMVGGVLGQIPGVSSVAERAPFEGKPSISAEAKALSQAFQKATLDDVWSELKDGKTSLDLLYGGEGSDTPRSWLDFIGNLHGALKVLPKRAEFFRRLEIGTQWAIDHNLDISDPKVQSLLTAGAYEAANRAIFMDSNVVNSAWNMTMTYLHNSGAGGRAIEAAGRFFFPIIKVPLNFASEVLQYTPGGLAWQTVQLFRVLMDEDKMGRSAIDSLSMHDMDNIMRGLKKGSAGLALMFIGYALRDKITGFYKPSQKRTQDEPGEGTVKIGNTVVPNYLLESPALQTLQMGATVGHVWDHYRIKGQPNGFVAGSGFAAKKALTNVPFIEEPARVIEGTRTPEQTGVFTGELAASLLVPLGGQQVARWTDPSSQKRKPKTATEAFEMAVPGLRERVPFEQKQKRFSIRSLQ